MPQQRCQLRIRRLLLLGGSPLGRSWRRYARRPAWNTNTQRPAAHTQPPHIPSAGLGTGAGAGYEAEFLAEVEGKRDIADLQRRAHETLSREYQDLQMQFKAHREQFSESQERSLNALGEVSRAVVR